MISSRTKRLYLMGQGFTHCKTEPAIQHFFLANPHVYTPYTPYQAEISQGRLELLNNYQQFITKTTTQDVAVASLIDNGQVAMDIMTLMKSQNKKAKYIGVQGTINQTLLNVMNTRAAHLGITIKIFNTKHEFGLIPNAGEFAGFFFQTPDTYGLVHNFKDIIEELKLQNSKSLFACHSDLMYMNYYDAPSKELFDFTFGNGGNVGIGLNYGGPQPAFLAANKRFLRNLPGRIIGTSKDVRGQECFRMALQTREQHIRRETATSNVCTSQALLANMSISWAMLHGKDVIHNKAKYILDINKYFDRQLHIIPTFDKTEIQSIKRVFDHQVFDTTTIRIPRTLEGYFEHSLSQRGVFPLFHGNGYMSFTWDETHAKDDVDYVLNLCEYIFTPSEFGVSKQIHTINQEVENKKKRNRRRNVFTTNSNLVRTRNLKTMWDTPLPNTDEQTVLRYLHSLVQKDYSLMTGMIPLGSCTMKHTPSKSMDRIMKDDIIVHPFVKSYDNGAYNDVIRELSEKLKDITAFDNVFYQSQSGAMGEYAGLTTIMNYHNRNNEDGNEPSKRNLVLMPRSAHGTNAATTKLAGCKVKYIKETDEGMIDMDDFKSILEKQGDEVACMMLTYPSTYGLYEKNVTQINEKLHDVGALCYMDGANMNALIGTPGTNVKPRELGFDVCHFNLHKSFAIPHGGGGPGMGPIAMSNFLVPYLPTFSYKHNAQSISTTPYGSGAILHISNEYLRDMNDETMEVLHNRILDTTRDVINRLSDIGYTVLHKDSPYRAHEFIVDTTMLEGVTETDIAKRLMDYGFHAPTMSWPVKGGLMIEITETENEDEISRFVNAMKSIFNEIKTKPEMIKNAPHTQEDICDWNYDYTIEEACYPNFEENGKSISSKYWPTVNRVDDTYGDKELMKRFK